MAKRREIRTVSFVHMGDQLVNTDNLDDDQRRRLATWLKTTYLNTLFQGKAVFFESSGEEGCQECRYGEDRLAQGLDWAARRPSFE